MFGLQKSYVPRTLIVPRTLEIDNCSTTKMIDDASAIIVQAVAFAAAKILHKEESYAVGPVRRSVLEVYRCLGDSYFQCAYCMSIILSPKKEE